MGNSKTNIIDVINRIDFNNEQQLSDLIQTIKQHYLYLDRPLETFITELSKRINVNNDKELDFLKNVLDASIINKEQIISNLISKMDCNNPKHFDFIKHFILNKSIQNTSINSKLIDKLDLGNKEHLNLITSLSRFSDEIIFKLIDKLNFNDKEQLYTISNLIVNIGFSNTNYIMNEVLAKLNLNNQKDLIVFEKVVCNYKFRTEELFEKIINMLDLNNPAHVKAIEKILNKEYFKILPVFNILIKHLNFNNVEHQKLFQFAVDMVIARLDREIIVNDIFKQTIGSFIVESENDLNFLTSARHQLLDSLLRKLIRLRTENLEIKNGLATIHLQNQTKLDSIKLTALKMKDDIESFDRDSAEKLNEILRNVELFENMQKHKTTIDEFAQQTGLSLLKPTPTTYLGNRRSIFTSLLKLLPKSLYDVKQHTTTFFMSKKTIDKTQLQEVSAKFDVYMKFLDENDAYLDCANEEINTTNSSGKMVARLLTTVSQNEMDMGYRSVAKIVAMCNGEPTEIKKIKASVKIRSSCGCRTIYDCGFRRVDSIEDLQTDEYIEHISLQIGHKILLEKIKYSSKDELVFKFKFSFGGEIDMVIYNSKENTCSLYEIKHSDKLSANQYRHLIDEEKCKIIESKFGKITGKYVLYRGKNCIVDDITYLNVEDYLCKS